MSNHLVVNKLGYIERAIIILGLASDGLSAHEISRQTGKAYYCVQALISRYKNLDGYISHFLRTTTSKEEFLQTVSESKSWPEVSNKFGVTNKRGRTLGNALKAETSHFINVTSSHFHTKEGFIEYVKRLKRRPKGLAVYRGLVTFIYEGKPKCSCGLETVWNGKPLRLQVDHIDGDPCNNSIENLRLICPNCHSQTPTYAANNRSRAGKMHASKIEWPSQEELTKMVWSQSKTQLAKELGVSDTAIAKKCKALGIKHPSRGYWAQQHSNRTFE